MDGHVAHTAEHQMATQSPTWPWGVLLVALAGLYLAALLRQPAGKRWPPWRTVSWLAGLGIASIALIGPVADIAHTDFRAHMLGHLLLGMLAPILLVLGAPVTLALRALPVPQACRTVRILSSRPMWLLTHPVTASVLNIGGLFILYRTDLFGLMHEHPAISLLVHVHVLAAGYLFTAAMIGVDPIAHRPAHLHRMVVLMVALGLHAALAKSLYAAPPAGVPIDQAEAGSMLMYYGGDIIDLLLIAILCWQWYRATAPRPVNASRKMPDTVVEAPRGGTA